MSCPYDVSKTVDGQLIFSDRMVIFNSNSQLKLFKKFKMTKNDSKLITVLSILAWILVRPLEADGFGDLLSCLGVANNTQVSLVLRWNAEIYVL